MNNVNDKKECEEHTMVEKTMDKIVALASQEDSYIRVLRSTADLPTHGIMVILVLNLRIM